MIKKRTEKETLLTLLCEWNECMLVFDNMQHFLIHIDSHLQALTTDTDINNQDFYTSYTEALAQITQTSNTLACKWSDCLHDTTFESLDDLTRHLKYHAFHQKLKCKGLVILRDKCGGADCDRQEQNEQEINKNICGDGVGNEVNRCDFGGNDARVGSVMKEADGGESYKDDGGVSYNGDGGESYNGYGGRFNGESGDWNDSYNTFNNIINHFGNNDNNQTSNVFNLNNINFNLNSSHSQFMDNSNTTTSKTNNTCTSIPATTPSTNTNNKCHLDNNNRNLIPDLPNPLLCSWDSCQREFNCADLYYRHVSNHVDDLPSSKLYNCQWKACTSKNIKSLHKLKCHLRTHSQEKVVACPTCGGLYANATKFLDHILRQADLQCQKYRCSHCRKLFSTERLLRNHMRQHVNHYKCPFCAMTCPTPAALRTHIHYRHSADRPFHCSICPFKAKASVDLRKHMDTHEGGAWVECSVGGCTFRTRFAWDLALHIKNKHQGSSDSKYQCHCCSSKFTRGAFLTRHLKSKHQLLNPSGHVRFIYKQEEDGLYRLDQFRYESSELREQEMGTEQMETTNIS